MNISNSIKSILYIEDQKLISTSKFIFFSFISFGLYNLWWMFKEWRFFQQKDNLDIMAAFRAIFMVFFLYSLFKRIEKFAAEKGYQKASSAGLLYIAYIFTPVLIHSLDPYGIISVFVFI